MKLIERMARDLCADDTRYHPTIDEEFWHTYERTARLFFQVLDEAGYVVVPKEPDTLMLIRALDANVMPHNDTRFEDVLNLASEHGATVSVTGVENILREALRAAPKVEDL